MTTLLDTPSTSRGELRIRCTWHELSWRGAVGSWLSGTTCRCPGYARARFGSAVFLCRAHYAAIRRGDGALLLVGAGLILLLPLLLIGWQGLQGAIHPLTLALALLACAPAAVLIGLAASALREGS